MKIISMIVVKLSALCISCLYAPGDIPSTHFCQRLSQSLGHSVAGRIKWKKNPTGNRTRDLPACSTMPQPTASMCTSLTMVCSAFAMQFLLLTTAANVFAMQSLVLLTVASAPVAMQWNWSCHATLHKCQHPLGKFCNNKKTYSLCLLSISPCTLTNELCLKNLCGNW